MTTADLLIVCSTMLVAAFAAARAYVAVRKGEADARMVVAEREARAAAEQRKAAVPISDLAAAVAQLNATAAALERQAGTRGPSRVGQRITVHTVQPDDQTLYGVCVGDYTDRISLEGAEYVTAMGPRPLSGRQEIETAQVAWVDVHGRVTVPDSAPATAEA